MEPVPAACAAPRTGIAGLGPITAHKKVPVSTGSAPSESAALNMVTAGLALTTVRSRIVAPAGPVLPVVLL